MSKKVWKSFILHFNCILNRLCCFITRKSPFMFAFSKHKMMKQNAIFLKRHLSNRYLSAKWSFLLNANVPCLILQPLDGCNKLLGFYPTSSSTPRRQLSLDQFYTHLQRHHLDFTFGDSLVQYGCLNILKSILKPTWIQLTLGILSNISTPSRQLTLKAPLHY